MYKATEQENKWSQIWKLFAHNKSLYLQSYKLIKRTLVSFYDWLYFKTIL